MGPTAAENGKLMENGGIWRLVAVMVASGGHWGYRDRKREVEGRQITGRSRTRIGWIMLDAE